MLLVSTNTIWATNQMSEKNAGSYLHFSIDTHTYLLRKNSKDRLPLPVLNLDKQASAMIGKQLLAFGKSEKSEFIYIGSFGLSGVTHIWGPNIGRSRRYPVWSHVCDYFNSRTKQWKMPWRDRDKQIGGHQTSAISFLSSRLTVFWCRNIVLFVIFIKLSL